MFPSMLCTKSPHVCYYKCRVVFDVLRVLHKIFNISMRSVFEELDLGVVPFIFFTEKNAFTNQKLILALLVALRSHASILRFNNLTLLIKRFDRKCLFNIVCVEKNKTKNIFQGNKINKTFH